LEAIAKQSVGRYLLHAYLGSTSMASVYLATDGEGGREVALKVLRPYLSQDSSLVERFLQEMERVRALQHPNIRRVYEAGQAGDLCYVAMEYTPWETLRERLRYPLPPQEAPAIISQVAEALDYALRQGVPHRDLKPTNIFLGPDLQILVTDFGMDMLSQAHQVLMKTDVPSPMAVYRAPELAQGAPRDPYTDIYSLGILAYELLTGIPPFNAITASTALVRQLTTSPLPPSQINPTLPARVDRVILRALNRRPEARFSTAQELQEALEQALTSPSPSNVRPTTDPFSSSAPEDARAEAVVNPAVAAGTDASAEAPVVMVQICHHCGAANELSVHYCFSCWSRLINARVVEIEEAERLLLQRRRRMRRSRLLQAAFIGVPAVVLAGVLVNSFAVAQTPPRAVTDPTLQSESRPGEWAMYQGNAARTGYTSGPTLVPAGQVAWTFESRPIESLSELELKLEGGQRPNTPLSASPAVVDGVLYLPTGDRRIVALDAATGRLLWQHEVTGPVDSSPAVAGDTVYVGLRDGSLVALDTKKGTQRWAFEAGGPVFRSPVVHEGTLYFTASDGFLYALDAATGDLRWRFQADGQTLSSPAVNHAVVAFTSSGNRLYILDRATGRLQLPFNVQNPTVGAPVIQDNRVMVTNLGGTVWTVDWRQHESGWQQSWYGLRYRLFLWGMIKQIEPRTGFLWQYTVKARRDRFFNGVAATPDRIFGCTVLGNCVALDPTTGEEAWQQSVGASVFSAPVVVGEVTYVGAGDGKVYGLDIHTGERVWEFATGGQVTANPVYANGMLYIASQDGALYAIR